MRLLTLSLLTVAGMTAGPIVRGTYSSSDNNVTCAGGGSHPQADCTVEYANNALMPIDDFAFILQASAGNRSSSSTDELAILDLSGSGTNTTSAGDLAWNNGTAYNFSAAYNASTRVLTYTVNGVATTVTIANAMLISDLFLRTQASAGGSTMKISNLTVDGVSLGTAQSLARESVTAEQVYYLWISGLENSFSISGKLTMTWPSGSSSPPSGTNVVAYMKFGSATNAPPPPTPSVPEPLTSATCGLGLILLGLAGRFKKARL